MTKATVLAQILRNMADAREAGRRAKTVDPNTVNLSHMLLTPYEYQKVGIAFAEAVMGNPQNMSKVAPSTGVFIADDMGLGKTAQAIGYASINLNWKTIVICPGAVKYNWQKEVLKFAGLESTVVESDTPADEIGKHPFTIINYEQLIKHAETLAAVGWDCVIVDECHMIKNPKAQRTKLVRSLFGKVPHKMVLSGTPIKSRPREFFVSLNFIAPARFADEKKYLFRYCGPVNNGYGWTFDGASNMDELHEHLRDIMIRRLKDEVGNDLPPKLVSNLDLSLEPAQVSEYKKLENNLIREVNRYDGTTLGEVAEELESAAEGSAVNVLASITTAKVYLSHAKVPHAIELAENILGDPEHKIIIFSQYLDVQKRIADHFGGTAVRIYGGMSAEKKQAAIDKFQTDSTVRVIVISTQLAVGMNLQAANYVIHVDQLWTPGEMDQADDRAHRTGQERCVNVYNLIIRGTIEESIINLLDAKRGLIKMTLDDQGDAQIKYESVYGEFLNLLRKKN